MSRWTEADLQLVASTDEVQVSSTRPDGTGRPAVTIWAVRLGDEVYVRSANGPGNGWFRRAAAAGTGRFSVAGRSFDVEFRLVDPDSDRHPALDAANHAKYDRYGPSTVGSVVGPVPRRATLLVVPRS